MHPSTRPSLQRFNLSNSCGGRSDICTMQRIYMKIILGIIVLSSIQHQRKKMSRNSLDVVQNTWPHALYKSTSILTQVAKEINTQKEKKREREGIKLLV